MALLGTPRLADHDGDAARPGFLSAQAIAKLIAAEGVNVKPYRSKAFCRRLPGAAPLVKMAAPGRGRGRAPRGLAKERVEPPRDRRGGIDKGDRPRRKALQRVDQQRKMGAGEYDAIGPPAVLFHETGRDLAGDSGIVDRLAAHGALGDGRKIGGADERHFAICGVVAHQGVGIVARDRAPGRENADQARPRFARRGLDRRHGADERKLRIGGPEMGKRKGRGGAAGNDDDVGGLLGDYPSHHRADPLDQGGVAEPAVGKGCVVSDIDDFDVGAKAADFGEHR